MYYLTLDLETLPSTPVDPNEIEPPKNYKNLNTIAKYQQEQAEQQFRNQALDSIEGTILAIGYAINDQEPEVLYNPTGDQAGEFDILTRFEIMIREYPINTLYFCGHNLKGFDINFLFHKAVKYQLAHLGEHLPRHPYSKFILDTQTLWAGPNTRSYVKLDKIAQFLGIESKGDIDGSKLYDYWLDGEHSKIREYCAKDVQIVRKVYKALNFEL